ncbi:MAG: hypothetical protein AB7N99_05965 [Simkaniaceae bacterium]
MTEVNEVSNGAEIINFEEILLAAIASAKESKSRDDAMSALLVQHLNMIAEQMQTEATIQKEISLLEKTSSSIVDFVPVN